MYLDNTTLDSNQSYTAMNDLELEELCDESSTDVFKDVSQSNPPRQTLSIHCSKTIEEVRGQGEYRNSFIES